jgi:hypothetical protein
MAPVVIEVPGHETSHLRGDHGLRGLGARVRAIQIRQRARSFSASGSARKRLAKDPLRAVALHRRTHLRLATYATRPWSS